MYIKRELEERLIQHLWKKEYTIITGARQTGKTTLLKRLYRLVREQKKVSAYVSFEDIDILNRINEHPEEIFSFIPRPEKDIYEDKENISPYYLFIDEIQYAQQPTCFLKYLFDAYQERLKIVATGSSAFYIDNKFTDSLAGRKRIFELKTLSFKEWLLFQKKQALIQELDLIRTHAGYTSTRYRELLDNFNRYLVYGGYPRVALEDDVEEKILLLKELKNAYLKKDIYDSRIEQEEKFYLLLRILASQTGNLVNRNELSKTVGVDNKTIDKYLYIMQKTFHISLLKPFYTNMRKELTKMPKIYFNDTGFRNVLLNRFYDFDNREDAGALFENYIHRRLTDIYDKEQVKYWRSSDKKEVDFVITTEYNNGKAYEVKLQCPVNTQRIAKFFLQKYPSFSFQIISYKPADNCRWFLSI